MRALVRRDGELFVFSAWGVRADWYRNIEAGGVDELWDRRTRYQGATFRRLETDEAYDVIEAYEQQHPRTARRTLPRMLAGYDFTHESRRTLAGVGTIVAFKPTTA